MITRRSFLRLAGAGTLAWYTFQHGKFLPCARAQIPGGTLDPLVVPKYQRPLLIPPVMPKAGTITTPGGKQADYYEISVQQFSQQILPPGLLPTTV